jgi:hypothetical protein
MDEMVQEVGERRVVQIVTDNEASYKKAGKLLMRKWPHLYWVPCVAHCIDLMLEDIGKEDEVKKVVEAVQSITTFIYSHSYVLAMVRQYTNNREILRPGPTRFASNYIALESVKKHRSALRTTFTSEEWEQYISASHVSEKTKNVALKVQQWILTETLWNKIEKILSIIGPLVKVLKMVDGDDKDNMGYLYEAMDRAKESIKSNSPRNFDKWWRIVDRRWDKTLHADIHAAGE